MHLFKVKKSTYPSLISAFWSAIQSSTSIATFLVLLIWHIISLWYDDGCISSSSLMLMMPYTDTYHPGHSLFDFSHVLSSFLFSLPYPRLSSSLIHSSFLLLINFLLSILLLLSSISHPLLFLYFFFSSFFSFQFLSSHFFLLCFFLLDFNSTSGRILHDTIRD